MMESVSKWLVPTDHAPGLQIEILRNSVVQQIYIGTSLIHSYYAYFKNMLPQKQTRLTYSILKQTDASVGILFMAEMGILIDWLIDWFTLFMAEMGSHPCCLWARSNTGMVAACLWPSGYILMIASILLKQQTAFISDAYMMCFVDKNRTCDCFIKASFHYLFF